MAVTTPNADSGENQLPADPFSPAQSQSLVVVAIARNKLLVVLLAVLLAAAGVAVGLTRTPTWTAASTLEVGANINPNSAGFSTFVQSATTLATTFSREITANAVLARIHRKTKLSPLVIAQRITATPVPDGAAINVIASGPTAPAAISLANAAASALVAHESASNFASDAPALYRAYQAQASVVAHARARVARIQAQDAQVGIAAPNDSRLVQAQADSDTALARASALSTAYTQALVAQPATAVNLVTPLAGAVSATSDRTHKIELLGFVGLVAGLMIGGAIAVLRVQRAAQREGRDRGRAAGRLLLRSPALIGLVLVAIVAVLYGVHSRTKANTGQPARSLANDSRVAGSRRAQSHRRHAMPAPFVARPQTVTLQLVATKRVWVCLVNGKGAKLIPGQTFSPGQTIPTETASRLLLKLGNASVQVNVNGKPVIPSPSSASIGFLLQPSGNSLLPVSRQPRCT